VADDDLHQPNDKLFQAAFGVPENTAAFLSAKLPAAVAAAVDWPRLRPLPGSFVDSQFRSSHTDLLFSAPMVGRDALIYVLFEHQSTRDRLLPLRLLRYMVRIWEQNAKQRETNDPLPTILPVVISQNAQSWDLDPRFSGLLDLPNPPPPEIHPCVPDFIFHHLQLADMPFDAIPGTPAAIFVLRTMKAERLGQLLDTLVWDEDLIGLVPSEIVEIVLRYILHAEVDKNALKKKLLSLSNPATRSIAMTLAESLRQEGRQEGRQEALQESVMNVLAARFQQVPDGLRDAIMAVHSEDHLRSLLNTAIDGPSLEVFAEGL
jgi:hypothetical protein